ncbi:hypothetical protein EV424DRAFT_1350727 [Suillus variegatus]|nr:hypothetical protein EV424DRAFT_1350727 [Suillus variegatus]
MKTKDWEDIEPVWQEYAKEQFGAGARDGAHQVKGGRKRIRKPAFELEMDGEGICSGKEQGVVPWSAIVQVRMTSWPDVPADVDLKEPSKLQIWDTLPCSSSGSLGKKQAKGPHFCSKHGRTKMGTWYHLSYLATRPLLRLVYSEKATEGYHPKASGVIAEAESDKESAIIIWSIMWMMTWLTGDLR